MPDTDFSALMCPHCLAEFTIQPVLHGAGQSAARPAAVPAAGRSIEIGDDDDEADAGEAEVIVGAGATHAPTVEAAPAATNASAARASLRGRRKGPGLKAHLVGVVGGGALGLAVGYYLLNYIGGPKFNFLDIPLPGIEHTQRDGGGRAASDDALDADELRGDRPSRPQPRIELPKEPPRPSAPVDPPPSNNGPPARTTPRPRSTPSEPTYYSAAELGAAAALARQALDKSKGAVSADAYRRLCRLAEMVTFADPADGGVPARQGEVILALQAAAGGAERIDSLGEQAASRLSDAMRVGGGIVLAGTVTAAERRGEYHLLNLALANGGQPATVVSRSPAGFTSGDRVVIAGVIVDQPSQQFPGVDWDNSPVVLGGMPLRIK